ASGAREASARSRLSPSSRPSSSGSPSRVDRVRFGTLGAAKITPAALVRPARQLDEAEVVAVAARDRERAGAFAKKHGIPTVLTSYDELVTHPDVDAVYNPLANPWHCRWTLAALDAGGYPVSIVRHLAGAEPEVVSARALLRSPGVDRAMTAELRFADGRTGRIQCSMWSASVLKMRARVVGDKGEMRVLNPLANIYNRVKVTTSAGRRVEHVRDGTTYLHQLKAFCAAVLRGAPVL